MRASLIIAFALLVTAWTPALLLPLPTWGYGLSGVVTLVALAVVGLALRKGASGNSDARRSALRSAVRGRAASATPEQQAGVAAMDEDLREALQKLAGSMPGRSGGKSVEALPWYLLMGPEQSGKSSVLASSGLPFAFVTAASGPRGSRGARWWLSDRAIFLDTAGQYLATDARYAEWLAFLSRLESTRPRQPLHGILLVLGADAVSRMTPEESDLLGRKLRERVDEAQGFLGVDVPVSIVLSRCDTLPGFLEFFADVRETERGQVWGFTLPLAPPPTNSPSDPVAKGFDQLDATLRQRMLRRLMAREHIEVRSTCYLFPQWFRSLRPNLLQIAANLAAHSVYQGRITLRGVYFTSAAEAVAVHGGTAAHSLAPTGQRGFFLRDLLCNIVVPDAEHATLGEGERARRRGNRWALATTLLCAAFLGSVLPAWSREENLDRVRSFRVVMNESVNAPAPVPLSTLDRMRANVASLRAVSESPPRELTLGMFALDRLAPRASALFGALVWRDVGSVVMNRLHLHLVAFATRFAHATTHPTPEERSSVSVTLRLYQHLTTPRLAGEPPLDLPAETEWFAAHFVAQWRSTARVSDPTQVATMTEVARLYARILAREPRLAGMRDTAITEQVSRILDTR